MQRLLKDGRIHPGRIEEVVERTRQEMEDRLRELGEQAIDLRFDLRRGDGSRGG